MIEESFDFIPYAQAPANKHLAEERLDSVTSRSNVSLIEKPLDSSDTWIPVRGKDLVSQGVSANAPVPANSRCQRWTVR